MAKITELPSSLKRFAPALTSLKEFLLKHEDDQEGLDCQVFCFDESGLRIAEISYARKLKDGGIAGWSIMRCEPGAGNMILAAEDFLLTFFDKPYRPDGWESDIDEHADTEWKLEHALKD